MPRRRALRALGGALEGGLAGIQDYLGLMMRQSLAQQNAAYQDALLRGRTADENVTSGKWSPEDATNYRRGQPVEPSMEDRMGDIFKNISEAPTQQTVPTEGALIGQMKAKRVPVTGFGPAPKTEVKEDGTLPSTPLGPIQSPQMQQVMGAVNEKLRAFPDEQIGTDVQGEGGSLQPVNIRGKYNRDSGTTEETTRIAAGPTASEKGTMEGTAAATSEDLQRAGKVQTAVDTAKALQPVQVQTAGAEALARQRAETKAAIERAAQTGGLLPEQVQPAMQLADDYANQSKQFWTVQDNFQKMVRMAQVSSQPGSLGAGDVGLMYAYMKIIDPGAAVQEGDKANVTNSAGVPDWMRNLYNKALTGQFLTPEQRTDFINAGKAAYTTGLEDHKRRTELFASRAGQFKIPANLVIQQATPGLSRIGETRKVNGQLMRVVDVDAQGNPVVEPVQAPQGGR